MKVLIILLGIFIALFCIALGVCGQVYSALRNTNKKLNAANAQIAAQNEYIKKLQAKQEIINDEQKKAENDKQKLHNGSNADKFNAANNILRGKSKKN